MTQQMPGPSRPPSAAPNGGRIVSQQRNTRPGPNQTIEAGYDVAFKTAKGVDGVVFVPEARYTTDNVLAAVRAAANQLDALHEATI